MTTNTQIEWADHTFNPWEGCQKVGPGCDHCYAEARNARFGGGVPVNWGPGAERRRTSPANWRKPLQWNKQAPHFCECKPCGMRWHASCEAGHVCPSCGSREFSIARQRVFCASLADVFDNEVDETWRADLLALIKATPNLDWLLLTKRIGNAKEMLDRATWLTAKDRTDPTEWEPLPNVWLGATIVNQEEADRDIPKLLAVPAHKRFLSMEPLLGPAELALHGVQSSALRGVIDWVIVGGESGPGARPMHPDWARSLCDQCQAAGVPFLFKQWGQWLPTSSADWCRSPSAPEHAAFREKYGRGGYEFPGKESRAILRDGRTCLIDPAGGTLWHRPRGVIVDQVAVDCFKAYVRTGRDDPGCQWVHAVGKKAAGRLLDGREWNEVPL